MPRFAATLKEVRQHCLQILEPCILGDKDAILPALDNLGPVETLVIVASDRRTWRHRRRKAHP